MFGWISLWPTRVGMWPRVPVRSLILIYIEVAVQGSLGEQGSCSEPKCAQTLSHVINLKSPEVNPKKSHRDIVVLVDHRHVLAAAVKVLCWQAPCSHGGDVSCRCPPAPAAALCTARGATCHPPPRAAHLLSRLESLVSNRDINVSINRDLCVAT